MSKQSVSLNLRVHHPNGKRTHHPAVLSSNGRVKPLFGLVNGKPTHLPGSKYYLRYTARGRRVWEAVGEDGTRALALRDQREHALAGLKLGLPLIGFNVGKSAIPTTPKSRTAPTSLLFLIRRHAEQVHMLRGRRTANQYLRDLSEFAKVVGEKTVTELTREDVQGYVRHLIQRKLKPKSIDNRLTTLKAFLRKQDENLGRIVKKEDAPRAHKKLPHAFTQTQVRALLAASGPEEKLIWQVFLVAGLREGELSHLGWEDIDFERCMIHLHAKPDLQFALKDREERQVPVPTDLMQRLSARKEALPHDRLVFPTPAGKPDGHLLRRLKLVAWKAGLNCGLCTNRAGKSCKEGPVCGKWQLHSFRRTAATRWHEAGLSLPTVQRLLGHSNIQTTTAYMGSQDLSGLELRQNLERSFAAMSD